MEKILTQEDQRYLRMICKYLITKDSKVGTIEIYLDEMSLEDINYDWLYFSGISGQIPDGLKLILEKIIKYIVENELTDKLTHVDYYLNMNRLEINIYPKTKEIEVDHTVSYVVPDEGDETLFDSDEDKETFDNWLNNGLNLVKVPENGKLTVEYHGSGDDGYLDDTFVETGENVPRNIRDFMAYFINSTYSGWENNLGAQGRITLNFNNKTIKNYHSYNDDVVEGETLWRENFAKRDI